MTSMYKITVIIILVALNVSNVHAQFRTTPKKIRTKGAFTYAESDLTFPVAINEFERVSIYSYDKKDENMSASYNYNKGGAKTTVTVYVYPRDYEGSLIGFRDAYMNDLKAIATSLNMGLDAEQYYVNYEQDGYKVNGFMAQIQVDNKKNTQLALYECGRWFFKIRVTSNMLNMDSMEALNTMFVQQIKPTSLVQKTGASLSTLVHVAPACVKDSLLELCVLAMAIENVEWAEQHIDSVERLAGFPSLYLDMYVQGFKKLVEVADEHPEIKTNNEFAIEYLKKLRMLDENGFLDEFVLENYNMVMIIPEGRTFEFEAYRKWEEENKIDFRVNNTYYISNVIK